ncbi:universal stress protein [Bordetella genomosp. 11]|uniref:Universal stress protein n=1 Tax=Bordetella genomosp. 11 TaxID=1416808 RepID=A0A261UGR1_9BORD|nr:universal stress protein [Bordetella genomosp. 11]OZI60602.1 hypothetical protein CAL28_14475 [Bordetella genomosp. 11]
MYRNIMIALDGSKAARAALDKAVQLAAQERATLYAVSVVEYPSDYYTSLVYDPAEMRKSIDVQTGDILKEAAKTVSSKGVPVQTRLVHNTSGGNTVAEQLDRVARELDADLVVMGTHGRKGVQRLLLGSVAEAFIRLTDRPVLLYPDRAPA